MVCFICGAWIDWAAGGGSWRTIYPEDIGYYKWSEVNRMCRFQGTWHAARCNRCGTIRSLVRSELNRTEQNSGSAAAYAEEEK